MAQSVAEQQEQGPPTIQRVGVIGYGYVGSAMGHALQRSVQTRFHDPQVSGSTQLAELVRWADALFVCVPTPQQAGGAANTDIVMRVMGQLHELSVQSPIVLKSTVPPGTCHQLTQRWPALRLVFSPEFLRERHHLADASAPARVVVGWTAGTADRTPLLALFRRCFPQVPLVQMGAAEAELLKYASNALFGVKVSFANEMSELAHGLGLDWEPVRQALVLDPRIGNGHLAVPGPDGLPGFGGSCLPKDMAGLVAVAKSAGVELAVTAAAVRANVVRRREGELSAVEACEGSLNDVVVTERADASLV